MTKEYKPDYWMDPDLSLVLRYCRKHWNDSPDSLHQCFFVCLILATGLRIAEAVDLRVDDCGPDFLHVRSGKGSKSRDVEIMPWFRPLYRSFVEYRRGRGSWLLSPYDPRRTKDQPVVDRQARRWWVVVCERSAVRYISPHGGRRTFATWASEMLSHADLQDQLGHADYRTTDRFYRGSMPGRRFEKIKPLWLQIAESWAAEVERVPRLRVVNQSREGV